MAVKKKFPYKAALVACNGGCRTAKEDTGCKNGCIGCGACAAIDSEHFTINDAGLSETTSQENLESPAVNEAIDACPVGAITLEEKKEN